VDPDVMTDDPGSGAFVSNRREPKIESHGEKCSMREKRGAQKQTKQKNVSQMGSSK
jgi:hypothetical protein